MIRSLLRMLRCLAPAASVLLFLPSRVAAGGDGLSAASQGEPLRVNAQGLLILKTGRTVGGRISQSAGGYVVDQPQGRIVVPFELVEFPARDLHDALRQYHERTPNPTAGFHVGLGEWCLRHQLLGEARDELLAALKLEPHRKDARHMLRRLDEVLDPPQPSPVRESGTDAARRPTGHGQFDAPDATSLAGLSRETARQFTERVQPILMNKCGNASCHGPAAENDFRLTRVRLTAAAHRIHAERNLAAILNYVDFKQPDRSRLVVIPQGNHGRAGQTIFSGPSGDEQLQILREWVRRFATEKSARSSDARHAPRAATRATGGLYDRSPDVLEQHEPADAFDPEEFNRGAADDRVPAGAVPARRGGEASRRSVTE